MAVTLIGEHLGGCTLLAELGSGGMATVYRAVRESDGAALAIKIISPKLTVSQQFITRFEREARVMQAFEHPYILPVYEFGQQDGLIYLMMALIEGGDLRDYLNQQRPTLAQIVTLLEQVGSALDYAHDQGVVHRDLKPANILMNGDQPFLSDFGIAKMKEESTGLTESGTLLGTPAYMAPEQWRSEPVNALTDIYALGVMSFEVLAGQLPFNADNPFSLMYRHLDEPPPLLYHLRPDLPVTLDRVIRRAMAKIPEQRYHRASDAISALREAAGAAVSESRASAALGLLDANTDTAVGLDDAAVGLDTAAPHTTPALLTPYDVVDVGARVLLERADEARRELTGTVAVLAQAATSYIQNLRERAKQRGHSLPYRALESYDLSDHHLFYGREAAVDGMLARLPGAKLAVLHAESGAGKTSLIRAGLMPRLLAGGYLPLYVAVRRRLPHEDIKHILWPDPALIPEMASTSLRDYLKMLTQIVGSNREIFIFVDQFETFFSDVFDEAERAACILEIAECLDDPLLPVRLTLALRTESFGLLARFQPQIPQPFANEFLLRPLTIEEAHRALIVPAQDKGFAYDESVVDALLQDLGGEGGEIAPPQLQLVGGALIEALPPERKQIELDDYQQAGRAEGILRGYLERLLDRLPLGDRQLARRVIESLVRADQSRDVRSFDSVQQEIQAAPEHLERVMTALRENRVLRLYEVDGEIV
ncbi:MAG: serine/threonine protein kinase, partial [Burkholderiales bacterium]|nr:serine/threonine protein kinase [Anaerolineae bacterium]